MPTIPPKANAGRQFPLGSRVSQSEEVYFSRKPVDLSLCSGQAHGRAAALACAHANLSVEAKSRHVRFATDKLAYLSSCRVRRAAQGERKRGWGGTSDALPKGGPSCKRHLAALGKSTRSRQSAAPFCFIAKRGFCQARFCSLRANDRAPSRRGVYITSIPPPLSNLCIAYFLV